MRRACLHGVLGDAMSHRSDISPAWLHACAIAAAGALACLLVAAAGQTPPEVRTGPAVVDTVDDRKPAYDPASLERAIHDRVNRVRAEHNRSRLGWADSLRRLARMHSRDMADRNFFAHTNPSGRDVNDRAQSIGLACRRSLPNGVWAVGFSENLYEGSLYSRLQTRYQGNRLVERIYDWKPPRALVRSVVNGWLNSPGHRKNLLSPVSRVQSIGVVVDGEQFIVTQVLC